MTSASSDSSEPPAGGAGTANRCGTDPGAGAMPKADVRAELIKGAGLVHGSQVNNYFGADGQQPVSTPVPWEDDLIAVPDLPAPGQHIPLDETERYATALQAHRVLLVRHAPNRQSEAMAAMRSVLHVLKEREPLRPAFVSDFDGTLQLHSLYRAAAWRADRRDATIYLCRSGDPGALSFFNNIERVSALCQKLAEMNCHLLLTTVMPANSALRDEEDLANRIALWSFMDAEHGVESNPSEVFSGRFETTAAACAALFPGLGVGEFVSLVDRLAPQPAPRPPLARAGSEGSANSGATAAPAELPAAPPSLHERWWRGERDTVLAELGVRLQAPPDASDAGIDLAKPGMFLNEATQRAELPTWLYREHPILLVESLKTLTAHYLAPSASQRFCVGYRRMILGLDEAGAHRLEVEWLVCQLRAALEGETGYLVSQRFLELLTEVHDRGDAERLVTPVVAAVADLVSERETWLVESLRKLEAFDRVVEAGWLPFASNFWAVLHRQDAARPLIEQAAARQAIVIDLLVALAGRVPAAVAEAVGTTLRDSNAAHEPWLQTTDPEQALVPVVSLARVVFRDLQSQLLRHSAGRWIVFAESVGHTYAPSVGREQNSGSREARASHDQMAEQRSAIGRWLSWDCVYAFATVFADWSSEHMPQSMYDALVDGDSRHRLGASLADLLRATVPSHWAEPKQLASSDEPSVDVASMLWLYQSLVQAAMVHETSDPSRVAIVVADLVAPWRRSLRSAHRIEVLDIARDVLDRSYAERDALADETTRDTRRAATQQIQSLQLVIRELRAAAAVAAA